MNKRHADLDLAAEDNLAIDNAITEINTRISIYPVEDTSVVRRLVKFGPQTGSFAREALEVGRQHEDLLPRGLNLNRFQKALDNYDSLRQRYLRLALMTNRVRATLSLLGADAYSDGLDVYHALQRGTDDAIREDLARLSRYFERGPRREEEAETAPEPAPATPAP
jgi:hypothetical protein